MRKALLALAFFLQASFVSAAGVILAWDEPGDLRITNYRLYRSLTSLAYQGDGVSIPVGTSTATINGLSNNVRYYFALRSEGLVGGVNTLSSLSNEVSVIFPPNTYNIDLKWGTQSLGTTSRTKIVTVTNNGTEPIIFMPGKTTPGGNGLEFGPRSSTCIPNTPLPAGASCTFIYVFKPLVPGFRQLTLTFGSNQDIYVLAMSGYGRGFTLNPETVAFGNVTKGTFPEKTIVMTNTWKNPITITSIVKGGSAFNVSGTCQVGMSLAYLQTCTFVVKVASDSLGVKGGSIKVDTDIALSGTAGISGTIVP